MRQLTRVFGSAHRICDRPSIGDMVGITGVVDLVERLYNGSCLYFLYLSLYVWILSCDLLLSL